MYHANLNRIVHDSQRQRERHDVHIGRYGPQVVVCLLVADVACAENLLNFAGDKEFLGFGGEVVNSVRDVGVTDDEDEG
jgi:hypothetical protein